MEEGVGIPVMYKGAQQGMSGESQGSSQVKRSSEGKRNGESEWKTFQYWEFGGLDQERLRLGWQRREGGWGIARCRCGST